MTKLICWFPLVLVIGGCGANSSPPPEQSPRPVETTPPAQAMPAEPMVEGRTASEWAVLVEDQSMADTAWNALTSMGEPGIHALTGLLKADTPITRANAVSAMGEGMGRRAKSATPEIAECMRSDTDKVVRMRAAQALVRIHGAQHQEAVAVLKIYRDEKWEGMEWVSNDARVVLQEAGIKD